MKELNAVRELNPLCQSQYLLKCADLLTLMDFANIIKKHLPNEHTNNN